MDYEEIKEEIDRLFKENGWTWKEAADLELIAEHFYNLGLKETKKEK